MRRLSNVSCSYEILNSVTACTIGKFLSQFHPDRIPVFNSLRVMLVLTTFRPPYRSFDFRFCDSNFVNTATTQHVMCSSSSYFLSFNHSKKGGDKLKKKRLRQTQLFILDTIFIIWSAYCMIRRIHKPLSHLSMGIEICKKKALYTTQFRKFNFRLTVFCVYFACLLIYIYAYV